jgi:hypothetical protein
MPSGFTEHMMAKSKTGKHREYGGGEELMKT